MPLINFTKTELQYIEVALFMLSQEKPGELLHSEESVSYTHLTLPTNREV